MLYTASKNITFNALNVLVSILNRTSFEVKKQFSIIVVAGSLECFERRLDVLLGSKLLGTI